MTLHARADNRSVQSIERDEKRRCSVSLIIMRHRRTTPALDRKSGLRPVQRLNLAFFVGAEHQRMLWRREV